MNTETIRKMLHLGESATLEFKTSLRAKESIGKIICSFLNASGGFVLCGVGNGGKVVGANESDAQISKFEHYIRESINPSALVTVDKDSLDGMPVIVIEVPKGSDPPYSFQHVHYLRTNETVQLMDSSMIRDIVLRSQIEPERWERRFSTVDPDEDLDVEAINKAVRDTEKVKRVRLSDPDNLLRVLEDLDVAKYGRLTNAGDVLFSVRPSARHPQARIRAMRYNSDKAGAQFSDMKSFEGSLNQVFEDAYAFIVRNTATVSAFHQNQAKREDFPQYPENAIREALINALAHRDYSEPSGGVAIHIYPGKLEIWNSGALPEGVTNESLRTGQISVLRNPDIAHVLYLRGFMEKAGRGSVLIISECKKRKLPEPQWKSGPEPGVTLTFFAQQATPQVTQQATPQVTQQVRDLLLVLSSSLSMGEILEKLDKSDRENVRANYLQAAIDLGLVEPTVPDKPKSPKQKYRLTPQGASVRKELEERSH